MASKMRIWFCMAMIALFGIGSFTQMASAHAYSAAYGTLTLTKAYIGFDFTLDELSVIELAGGDADENKMLDEGEFDSIKEQLLHVIQQHVALKIDGSAQQWTSVDSLVLNRQGDASKMELKVRFPAAAANQSVSLTDTLYAGDTKTTNYVDLLTIQYGAQTSTSALSAGNRSWAIQLTDSDYAGLPEDGTAPDPLLTSEAATESTESSHATSGWLSFFKLGMEHILGGYDHLLFLFSLLIARQTIRQYATMITAFTLAHSLTLTLTVLGYIDIPPKVVEPAIALSICYVALDNILRSKVSYRWVLTFLFGLIHGMGFADLLKNMNIPKGELAVDLTSFNLGIEAVQLTIVALLVPLLYSFQKYKHARKLVTAGSAIALILGGIWLFERLFVA